MKKTWYLLLLAFITTYSCQQGKSTEVSRDYSLRSNQLPSEYIENEYPIPTDFPPCGYDPIEDIIPAGYQFINSFELDIDKDSINEVLIHCLSDKKIDCELAENSRCFMDVLLLCKTNPDYEIVKTLEVPKPPSVANHEINLTVNSKNSVILKFSYAPVSPSNVTTTQFYSYTQNNFMLDSLTHLASTKMGAKLLSWRYNFNFISKKLAFTCSKHIYNDKTQQETLSIKDSILQFSAAKPLTISHPIHVEQLIPAGIESPSF